MITISPNEDYVVFDFGERSIKVEVDVSLVQYRNVDGVFTGSKRVQNTAQLKTREAILELIKTLLDNKEEVFESEDGYQEFMIKADKATSPTQFFILLAKTGALHREFYNYYTPEQTRENLLYDIFTGISHEESYAMYGLDTLIRTELDKVMIDFTDRGDLEDSSDRILFLHPVDQLPMSQLYLPHNSFTYYVDFNCNQENPRINASLVIGAKIEHGKIHKGTSHLSFINHYRPCVLAIDPVRLAAVHNGGIRKRMKLLDPRGTVIDFPAYKMKNVTNARVAIMDFHGFTTEEGIVISQSLARKLLSIRRETIRFYWEEETDSPVQTVWSPLSQYLKYLSENPEEDPDYNKLWLKPGTWIAHRVNSEIVNEDGDPEIVSVHQARCKWDCDSGFARAISTSVIDLNSEPEEYIPLLFQALNYLGPKEQEKVSELIRLLNTIKNQTTYSKVITEFTNKYNMTYLKYLISAKTITKVELVVDWDINCTVGSKLTTLQGWKGLVCAILPDALMPHVEEEGKMEPVEMIISPGKLRKRNILRAMLCEIACGRLGGFGGIDPFEDLYDFVVKSYEEQGWNLQGDHLKLETDIAHIQALDILCKKIIAGNYEPESNDRLREWVETHSKLEGLGPFQIELPFRTFWGYTTIILCDGHPAVSAGAKIVETGRGLSASNGAVKISLNEAGLMEQHSPKLAAWMASLGRGRTLYAKLRRSLVDGTALSELSEEAIKNSLPLPHAALLAIKEAGLESKFVEFLRSHNAMKLDRQANLRDCITPGEWTWTTDGAYAYARVNTNTGASEFISELEASQRKGIDFLVKTLNKCEEQGKDPVPPKGWIRITENLWFYPMKSETPPYSVGVLARVARMRSTFILSNAKELASTAVPN